MTPPPDDAAATAAARKEAARILDTSGMILSWLRLAVPSILERAGHRPRRSAESSHPVDRLVAVLADGVVLADLVSSLDPARLLPSAVLRATARNALSAPASRLGTSLLDSTRNVDARQREVQYRDNTRRVVAALKGIFSNVRDAADPPLGSAPGVVEAFVGDVSNISPARDLRPALRLAELVVAAAVYSPAHAEYRNVFWEFPSDASRRAFHKSMTVVSQAIFLPSPDGLYADGPKSAPPPRSPVPAAARRTSSSTASPAVGSSPKYDPRLESPSETSRNIVGLQRSHQAEAYALPLVDANAPPGAMDDGMGGRKFSMVTEDGNASRDSLSPPQGNEGGQPGVYYSRETRTHEELAVSARGGSNTEQVVETDFVESMRVLEHEHAARHLPSTHVNDIRGFDDQSKSASDEFFTPRENSPSAERSDADDTSVPATDQSRSTGSRDIGAAYGQALPLSGGSSSHVYGDLVVAPQYVDQTVRQSVTSSVTKQISQVQAFESMDLQEPMSGDMSSLDLGGGISEVGSISERHSLLNRREVEKPFDFRDPSYMFSPSGSDAPSPSNQWQIARQKGIAANITSPQQLFSPPGMPKRLGRTATATQMTPPQAPALFRAGSPQASVSSAGGRPVSEQEGGIQATRSQRVSFADNVISPGGHLRPLGKPLRDGEGNSPMGAEQESRGSGESFSLPPSAGRRSAPTDHYEGASGMSVGSRGEVLSPELSLGSVRDTSRLSVGGVESPKEERDADGGQAASDSFSFAERDGFQEVEEVSVVQDEQSRDRGYQGYETASSGPSSKVGLAKFGSENYEKIEQKGQDSDAPERLIDSPKGGSPSSANANSSARQLHVGAYVGDDDGEGSRGLDDTNMGEGDAYESGYMTPDLLHHSISPYGYSSTSYRSHPSNREVPPTPPSPPTVAALVESFTEKRHTPRDVESRPVSTMAPSAGLFQKLISVWQNADEAGREGSSRGIDEGRESSISGPNAASLTPDADLSHSTAPESTLPSGDTDLGMRKPDAVVESPRSRRPRGMRLAPSSPSAQKLGSMGGESVGTQDEKGSVASFSDAFSSDRERSWLYSGQAVGDGYDWEEAMRGDHASAIPSSSASQEGHGSRGAGDVSDVSRATREGRTRPPLPPSPRSSRKSRSKSHTTNSSRKRGVVSDGQHIKVDRRRLDWLTRELLSARDVIARQELQMTFAETQRTEQEEVLLLDKQNAESVVDCMKRILSEREKELHDARGRLSVAIDSVSVTKDRGSLASATSMGGNVDGFEKFVNDGHAKLHAHIDESGGKNIEAIDLKTKETQGLLVEVQRAMVEKMSEMTERRDGELDYLRRELEHRQKMIDDLQVSKADLRTRNDGFQSEVAAIRMEKEKASHRYQMEMAHVSAQVELVNEFSKKLHDNFRETENLRQQVLQYQDKLSHITSTSGVSQRQIKELREAVTRANDECARLRREADFAKRKGMEAVRRAEELEELRHKDAAVHNASRYPDRQDRTETASFHSHEPVRPAGHNRPGGSGTAARYHGTRTRGIPASPTPAQKAWLVIKDKIGGIVTGKESTTSRRRGGGPSGRRDNSRAGSGSRSSGSNSRSRHSPRDEDILRRSRSASVKSRSSNASASSARSGVVRTRSASGRRTPPTPSSQAYMHGSPRSRGESAGIRAVDF